MNPARVLVLSLTILLLAGSLQAKTPPRNPLEPTGCMARNPGEPFRIQIFADRSWGLVPFQANFSLAVVSGKDSLISASWDFDGDGLADASGFTASHTFSDPAACNVTAEVETRSNGLVTDSTEIDACSALMSITFDDGQESVYSVAYPMMASRGVAGTVYAVTSWIRGGWYLSWDQLTGLYEDGWDIGSHTLTHRDLTTVDSLTLDYELSASRAQLQAHGFPGPNFSVPFGACSWTIVRAAKRHYESCRGWKGLNPPLGQTDPYLLQWDVTSTSRPLGYYTDQIDSVVSYGGWYILNNHLVYDDCHGMANCVSAGMLADVMDYALTHHVKIVTVAEALGARSAWRGPARPPRPGELGAEPLALAVDGGQLAHFPLTVHYRVAGQLQAEVEVFDVSGRVVKRLATARSGGRGTAVWDGRSDDGREVSPGCYFCVLATADRIVSRKVVVTR